MTTAGLHDDDLVFWKGNTDGLKVTVIELQGSH